MRNKILIELFIRKFIGYFIFLIIVLSFSLIAGKFWESLVLIVSYTISRNAFQKQLHLNNTINCIKLSIIIFLISIISIFKFNISLISCCLVGFLINYVCNLIVFLPSPRKEHKRDQILKYVSNDEEEIEKLCKELVLINISETIYLYLNNSLTETAEILEIDTRTVSRRINRFLKVCIER